MIAARWAILAAATAGTLAAFGAPVLQPSALRVAVTAAVGLLAPLFWPGRGATAARTVLRVVGWSAGAASLALIALLVAHQGLIRIVPACAMLTLILIATLALAVAIERFRAGRSGNAEADREMAGRTATIVLAFLGAAPLWLGPAAELLVRRAPWVVDAVLGASPLTHLAVASGNDLLRNAWFYQHANLAALRFSYPALSDIILFYGAAAVALTLLAVASWKLRRTPRSDSPNFSPTEQAR